MQDRDTGQPNAGRRIDALWSAVALLTRLPVPDHQPSGAQSAWAWPLVGAGLGAVAGLAGSLALWLGLAPGMAAALVMAIAATLTGALHEDGLADTFDGLFGGRDKARRLEIMKDSRIGSFGALALGLSSLALWSGLSGLMAAGQHLPALVAAGAVSRAAMAGLMAALPNARGGGLSHSVGRPGGGTVAVAAGLAVVIALACLSAQAAAMVLAALVVTVGLGAVARAKIGGQTGDILGAGQQLAQLACIAVLVPG